MLTNECPKLCHFVICQESNIKVCQDQSDAGVTADYVTLGHIYPYAAKSLSPLCRTVTSCAGFVIQKNDETWYLRRNRVG